MESRRWRMRRPHAIAPAASHLGEHRPRLRRDDGDEAEHEVDLGPDLGHLRDFDPRKRVDATKAPRTPRINVQLVLADEGRVDGRDKIDDRRGAVGLALENEESAQEDALSGGVPRASRQRSLAVFLRRFSAVSRRGSHHARC